MSLLVQDFDRWKYILDKKNTSTDSTFTQLLQDIRFSHKELTNDILQIVKINTHVETHRDRFGHISEDELNNRKGFALEIKGKLNDIDSVINSERTTKKMQEDKDRALQDMSSALSRLNTNAGTIQNQLHTQTELLEEMDQRLDDNQNLMDVALHKMDAVLNKSTAGKWTIIGIELVIAFVLLALIVI
jgi:chromosome segregation ATPase